jgi:hypothetical protein
LGGVPFSDLAFGVAVQIAAHDHEAAKAEWQDYLFETVI